MGIFDKILGRKEEKPDISSILPQEIFQAGVLELKDIIAPSAIKVSPKEINLGEKILRSKHRQLFYVLFLLVFLASRPANRTKATAFILVAPAAGFYFFILIFHRLY